MRRVALLASGLLVVGTACGDSNPAGCSSAWIGSASRPLTASGGLFSIGAGGSVRRATRRPPSSQPALLFGDPSGRRVAMTQGRRATLVMSGLGRIRTIARWVVAQPVWRPDGGAVAFGQRVGRGVRLRVADARTGFRVRQLRVPLCPTSGLTWSPDGRLLALTSPTDRRDCKRGATILLVDAADGDVVGRHPIAGHGQAWLAWSADGRYLRADDGDPTAGIVLLPRAGHIGTPRTLTGCFNASWSPRGARLSAECRGWLTIVDPRTGRRLDVAQAHLAPGAGPVWSPDGTALAASDDGGFLVATPGGRVTRVQVGGCWAGRVEGFTRGGRAVVEASVAPQGD